MVNRLIFGKAPGFSLIELMVVLAIMGTLMLISVPSYQMFMQENRRALAKQSLVSCSSKLIKQRIKVGSLGDVLEVSLDSVCQTRIPINGEIIHYQVYLSEESTDKYYTLIAEGKSLSAKEDGDITLDSLGLGCHIKKNARCVQW